MGQFKLNPDFYPDYDTELYENRKAWSQISNCKDADPGLFYIGEFVEQVKIAAEHCYTCPARAQCLEWAIVYDEQYGVWGGMAEQERVNFRRKLRAMQTNFFEFFADQGIRLRELIQEEFALRASYEEEVVKYGKIRRGGRKKKNTA